jgi:hypothetical protein
MAETTTHGPEVDLLMQVKGTMDELKSEYPAWCDEYEDVDPITAERASCERLLQTAPNPWAAGLVSGIMLFRQQLALVTSREY